MGCCASKAPPPAQQQSFQQTSQQQQFSQPGQQQFGQPAQSYPTQQGYPGQQQQVYSREGHSSPDTRYDTGICVHFGTDHGLMIYFSSQGYPQQQSSGSFNASQPLPPPPTSAAPAVDGPDTYIALYDYDARTSDDLTFRKGDKMTVCSTETLRLKSGGILSIFVLAFISFDNLCPDHQQFGR